MYSKFTLRLRTSNTTIEDDSSLALDCTALVNGGTVEMIGCVPQKRQTCDFKIVTGFGGMQRLILPKDTSVLAVLSYIDCCNPYFPDLRITDITLWYACVPWRVRY